MIMNRFRRRFARAYHEGLQKQAIAHTRRLNREATALGLKDDKITVNVHGEVRAQAYMKIGWHPLSETYEAQQWGSFTVQVPIFTLQIDRW